MNIRTSTLKDFQRIMEIIDDAKALLKSLNIDQWQNGYPNAEQIENDIQNQESFVITSNKDDIAATLMFSLRSEPTYKKVFDGEWIIDETKPYGVIHRLAMSKDFRGQGIAKYALDELHKQLKKKGIKSLKIDTHEDNLGMQSLIKKIGYQFCGIIYTNYGDKRLAFEKVIS